VAEPKYDKGVLIPERDGYCSCYCGEKHNGETYKLYAGTVYWFKHGKYPDPQSHVSKFLTIAHEPRRFDVA
jgi:hypothetical protein